MIGRTNAYGGGAVSPDVLANGMSLSKSSSITASKPGVVIARGERAVTNHDNSTTGYIAVGIEKNGGVVSWNKEKINGFSGGYVEVQQRLTVNTGDTITIVFKNLNDSSSATWNDPTPAWSSGLESCHTNNVPIIASVFV